MTVVGIAVTIASVIYFPDNAGVIGVFAVIITGTISTIQSEPNKSRMPKTIYRTFWVLTILLNAYLLLISIYQSGADLTDIKDVVFNNQLSIPAALIPIVLGIFALVRPSWVYVVFISIGIIGWMYIFLNFVNTGDEVFGDFLMISMNVCLFGTLFGTVLYNRQIDIDNK